jgi:hypothetical protein
LTSLPTDAPPIRILVALLDAADRKTKPASSGAN